LNNSTIGAVISGERVVITVAITAAAVAAGCGSCDVDVYPS